MVNRHRNWLAVVLFVILTSMSSHGVGLAGAAEESSKKEKSLVKIAVLDTGSGSPHENQIVSDLTELIKIKLNSEKTPAGEIQDLIQIKVFPIYTKNGTLTEKQFLTSLQKAAKTSDVIHLSWNILSTAKTLKIETALKNLNDQKIIIAAAGNPENSSFNQKLETSVMGKVPGAFIVGELDHKGHLSIHSFFGREMFTALTPVQGRKGSSFSSIKLTAAIALRLSEMKTSLRAFELKEQLRLAKQKSFSVYPTLRELGLEFD